MSIEGTVRLDKVPEKDRSHNHEIEAGRLSGKEAEIVVEADKATLLLHDDGTAVAFPEALRQMRQDMQQIVGRLAEAKVGKITQGVEKDVIAALEEMLDALKKAQKDLEDRKQRPQGAGEPQSPALVDTLAELKMIRAPAGPRQRPHRATTRSWPKASRPPRRLDRGLETAGGRSAADLQDHPRHGIGEEPMSRQAGE